MNLDTFLHLVDRVGAPMGLLIALVYLLAKLITGPGNRMAELAGGAIAEAVKSYFNQLATREHVTLEHTTTRATVEREHAETRATVARQGEQTREHVTEVVGALQLPVMRLSMVSAAELAPPSGVGLAPPAASSPAGPVAERAPRPPAPTLPSAETPATSSPA